MLLRPRARNRGLRRGTRVQLRPMGTDDDGELMLRYARGDMRAFETLYRRHKNALYRYLARQTRNVETANDLFQEVWSKVIVSRERYEPRAQFRTFLYRIAHNCFIDYCRRSSVRNESNGGDDGWESMLPGSEQDRPDTRAEQAQLTARYRAALETLPAEQRDVFLLYESGLVARRSRGYQCCWNGNCQEPPPLCRREITCHSRTGDGDISVDCQRDSGARRMTDPEQDEAFESLFEATVGVA